MLLTIHRFTLLLSAVLLTVLYTIFGTYYLQQREATATVIFESVQNDLSEMSYVLSKNVTSVESVKSFRGLLDRAVANNDYVRAIVIADDRKILLSTDPYFNTIPSKNSLYHDLSEGAYHQLMEKKALEGSLRYYEGEQVRKLQLLFFLDHEEIASHFSQNSFKFLTSFGLLPIAVLAVAWLLILFLVTKPLEKLRQYAYYQSIVPQAFKLKELEAIRSSMVQTFSRLEAEQHELYTMARTDSLSGLANRNALNEYLQRLIADSQRTNREFALLFLDLDHFKSVNDALGHHIGDELLQNVASSLSDVLRANDFVARVGGDEFIIVLHQDTSLIKLIKIIKRIQERLQVTWLIQTHPVSITGSVGVAFYPKDGADMISLMQHADIAMYEAKKKGRAQYHFYTEELNAKVQRSIALDKAMRDALKNGEYLLYYQPKTDLASGAVVGAEALIRWSNPEEGMIPPSVFIPLAEENGFIIELGTWVLNEALRQQAAWQKSGIAIPLSINVAAQQLLDTQFKNKLTQLLQEHDVAPSTIDIEITEYLFFDQTQTNLEVLNMLHDLGISISLDDFGTGYSSLAYLKKFPIDTLKIDKTFMDDYDTAEGAIFLETIVKMGQTLKIDTIAEGVESAEQVAYLKSIGCDLYQGYYCSKPLSAAEFEQFYRNHPSA